MLEDNIEIKRMSGTKPQDQLTEWVNNGK